MGTAARQGRRAAEDREFRGSLGYRQTLGKGAEKDEDEKEEKER